MVVTALTVPPVSLTQKFTLVADSIKKANSNSSLLLKLDNILVATSVPSATVAYKILLFPSQIILKPIWALVKVCPRLASVTFPNPTKASLVVPAPATLNLKIQLNIPPALYKLGLLAALICQCTC